MAQVPTIVTREKGESFLLELHGQWQAAFWHEMHDAIAALQMQGRKVLIDFAQLQHIDTYGAWLLKDFVNKLQHQDVQTEFYNQSEDQQKLLKDLEEHKVSPTATSPAKMTLRKAVESVGEKSVTFYEQQKSTLSFLGWVVIRMMETLINPRLFRYKSFVKFIEETGLYALPIVGIISFMIGVVMVYQGTSQLERFGASIFTVNLLGVSILRELGILITAIVVAGRSGSSFTAQIGFMKLNQEIDAMLTLGLNPLDLLVIPRIAALILTLTFLTLYADFMGLVGGGVMALNLIDLSWQQFLHQLNLAIGPWTFWTGLIKAPLFGFIIALIGCHEGISVSGGSEEVGRRTTRSVVRAIFIVITLDALFSVLYSKLGI